jgi:dipeptidyl aminopeptidase/acylaminoacyl peptidase
MKTPSIRATQPRIRPSSNGPHAPPAGSGRQAAFPLALLLAGTLLGAGAAPGADATAWPHAEDIPTPSKETPALAGGTEPDIVRYLMVRGARGAISPDGTTLAYTSSVTGEPQLWSIPVDGGFPKQLTFGRGISSFHWVPDGSGILYGADRDGNEREGYVLITPDGLREHAVRAPGEAFLSFGSFSDDNEHFVYSTTERNGVDFDVHVASTADGSDRKVYEGRFGFFADGWQPNGSLVLVRETRGEDANDVYLLNVITGSIDPLFQPDVAASYADFEWKGDGSGFYLVTNQDREYAALGYYDIGAHELSLLETPRADVEQVELFDNDRFVAWTTNVGGYSKLQVYDLDRESMVPLPESLPVGVYGLSGARHSPRLMVSVSGPQAAGDLWVWDLSTGGVRAVVPATTAGLDMAAMSVPESLFFDAEDGVQLNGLLYMPTTAAAEGKPPVVLHVHGGPTGQARPAFRAVTQYLVARGIAVFDLNFRGSTGFGKTFARLDNQRLRPNAVRDMADAVAFLEKDCRVDASRVALMGGSYGGYLTNAGLGEFPNMFAAGVSFVGVSDWVRALEEASPALKASDRIEYGDITDPGDREFFRSISPINNVDRIVTPLMVLHGANDPRDPVTESDRFVQAIRDNGQQVVYLRFADEGHGIRRLGNRVTAYTQVAEFLESNLGMK